jgi:hypothetical protein
MFDFLLAPIRRLSAVIDALFPAPTCYGGALDVRF